MACFTYRNTDNVECYALVGDDIFGSFCFLICFAMVIALCWIISVKFLFRLSGMSSCSSSAVNLFFNSS